MSFTVRRVACRLNLAGKRFSSSPSPNPSLTIIRHPFSLDGQPLEPATGPVDQFAIIEFLNFQYKVCKDDALTVDNFDVDIGETVELDKVLMVGSKHETYLGRPFVDGAKVLAVVEEKVKDAKVIAFKKRRRKNKSQTLTGHRRRLVKLRISDIILTTSR